MCGGGEYAWKESVTIFQTKAPAKFKPLVRFTVSHCCKTLLNALGVNIDLRASFIIKCRDTTVNIPKYGLSSNVTRYSDCLMHCSPFGKQVGGIAWMFFVCVCFLCN